MTVRGYRLAGPGYGWKVWSESLSESQQLMPVHSDPMFDPRATFWLRVPPKSSPDNESSMQTAQTF